MSDKTTMKMLISPDRLAEKIAADPDVDVEAGLPQTTVTRDAMWRLVPGLLVYNLIGRHILYRGARRQWIAGGGDLSKLPRRPSWITLAEMRAVGKTYG